MKRVPAMNSRLGSAQLRALVEITGRELRIMPIADSALKKE
jgi:hypothetical protein